MCEGIQGRQITCNNLERFFLIECVTPWTNSKH